MGSVGKRHSVSGKFRELGRLIDVRFMGHRPPSTYGFIHSKSQMLRDRVMWPPNALGQDSGYVGHCCHNTSPSIVENTPYIPSWAYARVLMLGDKQSL
jgi:hypothetical protein